MTDKTWESWNDVGGTLTDCLARRPDGELLRHELQSWEGVKGAAEQKSTACQIEPSLASNQC